MNTEEVKVKRNRQSKNYKHWKSETTTIIKKKMWGTAYQKNSSYFVFNVRTLVEINYKNFPKLK